jgi:hypothetical protein
MCIPFDADLHWPQEIASRKMETYHEWMKAVLLISMSGCPALAVPAGFGNQNSYRTPFRRGVKKTWQVTGMFAGCELSRLTTEVCESD